MDNLNDILREATAAALAFDDIAHPVAGSVPQVASPMRFSEAGLVFDRAPPFYDNSVGVGYDGANADVIGRYVSLQLTRRW